MLFFCLFEEEQKIDNFLVLNLLVHFFLAQSDQIKYNL